MIESRWVFDDAYETKILHRHTELQSLSRLLGPTQHGLGAKDVLIHGPSGVGKTASARWMLRDRRQRYALEALKCFLATVEIVVNATSHCLESGEITPVQLSAMIGNPSSSSSSASSLAARICISS